jgi:hypothetical protein
MAIPLLEPTVLLGVVEQLTVPTKFTLLSRLSPQPYPTTSITWDVIRGSRMVGKTNTPGAEANVVDRLGREQSSATMINYREKKVFDPVTLRWLRAPGQLAASNAEAAVLREVNDLNQRLDNLQEICLFGSLRGSLTVTNAQGDTTTLDYKFRASHKPSPAVSWATATPAQIEADVIAWKLLVERDGGVGATEAFASSKTLSRIYTAWTSNGADAGDINAGALMSDRMKDEYFRSGKLEGFLGLRWTAVDHVYEDDNGVVTPFVADDELMLGNYTEGDPLRLYYGPTADEDAPAGHTGKFTKTWIDKDPSGRQVLLDLNFAPVPTRVDNFVWVSDLTP